MSEEEERTEDELQLQRTVIGGALWPEKPGSHLLDVTSQDLWDRGKHLARTEHLAARLVLATDGDLGPLDYETPEEALEKLRAHLKEKLKWHR